MSFPLAEECYLMQLSACRNKLEIIVPANIPVSILVTIAFEVFKIKFGLNQPDINFIEAFFKIISISEKSI